MPYFPCRRPSPFRAAFFAAVVVLSLGVTNAARADWTPRVEARTSGDGMSALLLVNGEPILTLRQPRAGIPAGLRAQLAADRLRRALAVSPAPTRLAVAVRPTGKGRKAEAALMAGNEAIATVSFAEARTGGGSAPARLVSGWAERMRRALTRPGLTASAKALIVPVGESRRITFGGAARGPLVAVDAREAGAASAATDGIPAQATADSAANGPAFSAEAADPAAWGASMMVTGRRPGDGTVTVEREGAIITIPVAVRPWAGQFADARPVVLTTAGARGGVDRRTVVRLAEASARAAARAIPGAVVVQDGDARWERSRPFAAVPVRIIGSRMLPVERTVAVPVLTTAPAPAGARSPATLLYSNRPERVARLQNLFAGRLAERGRGATRLLYHHQSALPQAAAFVVELVNDGDAPATVEVRGGAAGPVTDTVWVGVRAGVNFLEAQRRRAGYVLEVPARSRVPVLGERLPPGETISGLCELIQTDGPKPLEVRVSARPRAEMPAQLFVASALPGGAPPVTSADIYDEPVVRVNGSYRVGESWSFLPLGRARGNAAHAATAGNAALEALGELAGHYGFTYEYSLTLENKTDRDSSARVVFEPSAGVAGGVFEVDGVEDVQTGAAHRVITIPQARENHEIELVRVPLPAGATRRVRVTTVPLSGSNYPARLIVRP
jgi:hypothetical protein